MAAVEPRFQYAHVGQELQMEARLALVLAMMLSLLIAACQGDSVPDGRTGISGVDTVIDAIEAGDPAMVKLLLKLGKTPCLRGGGGVPPPPTGVGPRCADGEATGTLVDTFPEATCEGLSQMRISADSLADRIAGWNLSLYAVYEAPVDFYTPSQHVAIFSQRGPDSTSGVGLLLADGRIVGTDRDCGFPPDELVKLLGLEDPVLPPDP